ncbi:hypothetical protein ACIBG4_38315 [Nonomuraea sp. NPDC050383]|uniref:hypothetical protein n=1 Tax=Nonomuraea sp. NPDC050383 TaxID=3364362 RepID=UPI00379937CE
MNLGLPELLFMLCLALLAVAIIVFAAARAARRPVEPAPGPQEVDARIRHLAAAGKQIEAIKVLRTHTGMSLRDAKLAVDGLAHGRPIRHPALQGPALQQPGPQQPAGPAADLATRVRRLKSDGRADQAVFLVRGETGMGHDEAVAFVDSIQVAHEGEL